MATTTRTKPTDPSAPVIRRGIGPDGGYTKVTPVENPKTTTTPAATPAPIPKPEKTILELAYEKNNNQPLNWVPPVSGPVNNGSTGTQPPAASNSLDALLNSLNASFTSTIEGLKNNVNTAFSNMPKFEIPQIQIQQPLPAATTPTAQPSNQSGTAVRAAGAKARDAVAASQTAWNTYRAEEAAYNSDPWRVFKPKPKMPEIPEFTGDINDSAAVSDFARANGLLERGVRQGGAQSTGELFDEYGRNPRVDPFKQAAESDYEGTVNAQQDRVQTATGLANAISSGVVATINEGAQAINKAFSGRGESIQAAIGGSLDAAGEIPGTALKVFNYVGEQVKKVEAIYSDLEGKFNDMLVAQQKAVNDLNQSKQENLSTLYNDTADQIIAYRDQQKDSIREALGSVLGTYDTNDPRAATLVRAIRTRAQQMNGRVYAQAMSAYHATKSNTAQAYDSAIAQLESNGIAARASGIGALASASGVVQGAHATLAAAGQGLTGAIKDYAQLVSDTFKWGEAEKTSAVAAFSQAVVGQEQNALSGLQLMGGAWENVINTIQHVPLTSFLGPVYEMSTAEIDRIIGFAQNWHDNVVSDLGLVFNGVLGAYNAKTSRIQAEAAQDAADGNLFSEITGGIGAVTGIANTTMAGIKLGKS